MTGYLDRHWLPVDEEKCQLEDSPFECPVCQGHVKLDLTYFEQVEDWCYCPYCITRLEWPPELKEEER